MTCRTLSVKDIQITFHAECDTLDLHALNTMKSTHTSNPDVYMS